MAATTTTTITYDLADDTITVETTHEWRTYKETRTYTMTPQPNTNRTHHSVVITTNKGNRTSSETAHGLVAQHPLFHESLTPKQVLNLHLDTLFDLIHSYTDYFHRMTLSAELDQEQE